MSQRYQTLRGMNDLRPGPIVKEPEFEIHRWHYVENIFFSMAELYGYQEIRTPMVEEVDLFLRTSGETSDIVSKEMYDFRDKGDRHIVLRPEGTAPAMRAYLEHSIGGQGMVTRLSYLAPVFRYDRPQRGRYRQHHQAGLELIGSSSPDAEVEIMGFVYEFFRRLGLTSLEVALNTIGSKETRAAYADVIMDYLSSWFADQDAEAVAKARKNPLRLLDTKNPELRAALQGLPSLHNYLSDDSRAHFAAVQERLAEQGVPFRVNPDIVRGLDYYNDTVFELISPKLGAQSSLCGGGRYDDLVPQLGGPPTPSVGVGMGIERAIIVAMQEGVEMPLPRMTAYIIAENEADYPVVRGMGRELHELGVSATYDLDGRKRPQQFKQANRTGAKYAAIINGANCTVRDMESGEETPVNQDALGAWFKERG